MRLCEEDPAVSAGNKAGGFSFPLSSTDDGSARAISEGEATSLEIDNPGEPLPVSPPTKLEIKLSSSFLLSARFCGGDVYAKY